MGRAGNFAEIEIVDAASAAGNTNDLASHALRFAKMVECLINGKACGGGTPDAKPISQGFLPL
jgi:hypothetical protein